MFFIDPVDEIHFWVCGVLCSVYVIATIITSMYLLRNRFTEKQLLLANAYSQFMSLPVMPFVYHLMHEHSFSITIMSIYALSNLIWQVIFLISLYGASKKNIILPLSVSNMAGWITMTLAHYWFFPIFYEWFSVFARAQG